MDLCLVLASNHPIDSVQMLCYHERQAASHNPELLRNQMVGYLLNQAKKQGKFWRLPTTTRSASPMIPGMRMIT